MRRWRPLLLWLALAAVHSALYAVIVPPWQGPDEPRHFEIVALVNELGHMPVQADLSDALQARLLRSMWQHAFFRFGWVQPGTHPDPATTQTFEDIWPSPAHELNQPPGYYYLANWQLKLAPASWRADPAWEAFWLRLWCIPYALLTVAFAWLAVRELFPPLNVPTTDGLGRFMRGAVPAFVALLPMQAFVNAVVNNDGLVIAASSGVCWLTLRCECRQRLSWEFPLAVALSAVAIWAKRTALLVVLLLIWLLLSAALRTSQRWLSQHQLNPRLAYGVLASSFGCAALVALMALKSNGDAQSPLARYFHLPVEFQTLWDSGEYTTSIFRTPYLFYCRVLFESFWARFGWLNVSLAPIGYTILQALTLLVVFAALFGVSGLLRTPFSAFRLRDVPFGALLLCCFAPLATLLVVLSKEVLFLSYKVGVVPQGRYLFPALVPIAILFCLGVYTWGRALGPSRLLAVWVSVLLAFAGVCLFGYVLPFYKG